MPNVTIFRLKKEGSKPKLGVPSDVQPGDFLTFFLDGAFTTREVALCKPKAVKVTALKWKDIVLDPAIEVPYEDFVEAYRVVEDTPPAPAESAPEPVSKGQPDPAPAPESQPAPVVEKPKKGGRKRKGPPPGWESFVDPNAYK